MARSFRFWPWLLVVIWMGVIFYLSTDAFSATHTGSFIIPVLLRLFPHLSWQAIESIHLFIRKLGHIFEYGVLGILLWRASPERKSSPGSADWWRAGVSLVVATIYGATDEYHQLFVPSRGASVHDVMIDMCGAAIALLMVCLANRNPSPDKAESQT